MNSISCEHGALKRSCQFCEYEVEISRLRAENDHLRDTAVCIIRCPACGSESAGSNETAINKEVARLRAIVALLEKIMLAARRMRYITRDAERAIERYDDLVRDYAPGEG